MLYVYYIYLVKSHGYTVSHTVSHLCEMTTAIIQGLVTTKSAVFNQVAKYACSYLHVAIYPNIRESLIGMAI